MNRIDAKFQTLKHKNEKALITFVTAGDPDLVTTEALVYEMIRAGADLIELGVPFSDPMAEGPVIQAASARALEAGTTLDAIFEMVRKVREKTQTPLLLMMYLNCILHYEKMRFFETCAKVGIDGVIIPDLPFQEQTELFDEAEIFGIRLISLVAPTSGDRIKRISEGSKGFLYCVSSLGVTGERSRFADNFETFFSEIREHATLPTAVGFGVSTPEQARSLSRYADGVIVGSAIVALVAQNGKDSVLSVGEFVKSLKNAVLQK